MKTITLEDLRPTVETVRAAGVDLPIHPLRIRDLQSLAKKHSALVAPFFGPTEGRGKAIVDAILECDATCDVIDAAVRWEPGSAEKAPFSAVEEGLIVIATVKASIPELEKLMAEGKSLFQLLGLSQEDGGEA
jgi:hypothetical protein